MFRSVLNFLNDTNCGSGVVNLYSKSIEKGFVALIGTGALNRTSTVIHVICSVYNYPPPVISLCCLLHHVSLELSSTTAKLCNDEHLEYCKSLLNKGLCIFHILLAICFLLQSVFLIIVHAFTTFFRGLRVVF